jgi:hypothetical protein
VVSDLWDSNPDTFVPVFYHLSGDGYAPLAPVRHTFLGNPLLPHLHLDGVVDGEIYYDDWPADFAARQPVATDTTITMSTTVDVDELQVSAQVCVEAGGTTKDMRVYMVQVLDHYPDSEMYYRSCSRQMGTEDVNVAAGSCVAVNGYFTLDALDLSRLEDVGVVDWAQEPLSAAPAEVYQAEYRSTSPDEIFADDFESGNFSAWSGVVSQ